MHIETLLAHPIWCVLHNKIFTVYRRPGGPFLQGWSIHKDIYAVLTSSEEPSVYPSCSLAQPAPSADNVPSWDCRNSQVWDAEAQAEQALTTDPCKLGRPKLDKLHALCDIEKSKVVCVTETWLCDDIGKWIRSHNTWIQEVTEQTRWWGCIVYIWNTRLNCVGQRNWNLHLFLYLAWTMLMRKCTLAYGTF